MTEIAVSIETLSEDVLAAYAVSGMDRGKVGETAINWAFQGNPRPFAVARQNGEVVGLSAYIRSRLNLSGREAVALQAVDSFVSEKARGKGVFTRLAQTYDQFALDDGADLVWGFPNSNAAPAWFGKMDWAPLGQVPFLIKPLRAGFLFRKLGLPLDFPLAFASDQRLPPLRQLGAWADELWSGLAGGIECGISRDRAYLTHRLFTGPTAAQYRIVATEADRGTIVATTEANKHGGHIGYLLEAMGHRDLDGLLASELARLRNRGAELVLAWSYPWSANYHSLRKAGFFPLPEVMRPIKILFGARPLSAIAVAAVERKRWYLSYLDSDTV